MRDEEPLLLRGTNGLVMEVVEPKEKAQILGEDLGAVVYFIQQGSAGPVKIGYCSGANGVDARLRALQCGNPVRLHIRRVVSGSIELETNLHRHLAGHRLMGEWFEPTSEVLRLLDPREQEIFQRLRPKAQAREHAALENLRSAIVKPETTSAS